MKFPIFYYLAAFTAGYGAHFSEVNYAVSLFLLAGVIAVVGSSFEAVNR